jgi:hypothetical protein
MSKCHWCDEGRPFLPGQEGIQHVPLYAGGEHSGTMCYRSSIYSPKKPPRILNKIVDVVLKYRPESKQKPTRQRKKSTKKVKPDESTERESST